MKLINIWLEFLESRSTTLTSVRVYFFSSGASEKFNLNVIRVFLTAQ